MARRWKRKGERDSSCLGSPDEDSELPASSPEHIAACIEKLRTRTFEKDRIVPSNVTIQVLPTAATGFPTYRKRGRELGLAEWIIPESANNACPRILYFHGGGYEYMSPPQFRATTGRLAAGTGMPVLVIDYRKIPDHPHPAQLEDAVQAFEWIAEHGPYGASPAPAILCAGSSAGGGLALALAVKIRDEPGHGGRLAGVTVSSPQTDMTCSGSSYSTRRWRDGGGETCDPIFRGKDPQADSMPQIYKLLGRPGRPGSYPLNESSISPLHAALHNLPPTLIHVGDAEVMLSDAVDFGVKARAAGSPVEVVVWPRMWHCFERFSEGCGTGIPLKEGLEALKRQVCFLRHCAATAMNVETVPMSEEEVEALACREQLELLKSRGEPASKGKGKGKSIGKGKGKGKGKSKEVHHGAARPEEYLKQSDRSSQELARRVEDTLLGA